jgi:hypothetical protein
MMMETTGVLLRVFMADPGEQPVRHRLSRYAKVASATAASRRDLW